MRQGVLPCLNGLCNGANEMGELFGTDGVRGRANVYPMDPETVLRLGKAIGRYFKGHYPRPRILIGKDTRISGYMLEQALGSGICSVGVHVSFLGPIPTPGIAYLTRGLRACAGIVISASHNPYDDNGIKIFSADGYKLPDDVEDRLEAMMAEESDASHPLVGGDIGTAKRIDDAMGQYAVFLKEQFPKKLTLEGLRIVLDCANGAAYKVAPKVIEELGAETFLLGVHPNGVNINEDCGALHPEKLREQVKLYKADIGLALDGDADRLVVIDDKGQILDGDEILAICGIEMIKRGTLRDNTVVATIMSNGGLEKALQRHGGKLLRTKVGDRYVVEEMRRGDYSLGGEASGHLVFKHASTTGDGILAALHLLEIILESGKPVSELRRCMQRLPQVVESIRVARKVPFDDLPTVQKMVSEIEKTLGDEGRVLVRYSGTESKARVMMEGPDADYLENMTAALCQEITASIGRMQGGAKP